MSSPEAAVGAEQEMELLHAIADAVGEALAEHPRDRFGEVTGMGADGTPTSWVDKVAEEVILEHVEASPVPLNVLSEEAGLVDLGAERLLVVDPVDGTTNATRGIPFYCVSLAIGRSRLSDVDVALVQNLVTGDTYTARAGEGARLNGEPIGTVPYDPQGAVVTLVASRNMTAESLGVFLEGGGFHSVRHLGSAALEMCLVAQGSLDAYLHPIPRLHVQDIAAATLILREAGGLVLHPDGSALDGPLNLEESHPILAVGDRTALSHVEVVA